MRSMPAPADRRRKADRTDRADAFGCECADDRGVDGAWASPPSWSQAFLPVLKPEHATTRNRIRRSTPRSAAPATSRARPPRLAAAPPSASARTLPDPASTPAARASGPSQPRQDDIERPGPRPLHHFMDGNDAPKPWMPAIAHLAFIGPVGVPSSRCATKPGRTVRLDTKTPEAYARRADTLELNEGSARRPVEPQNQIKVSTPGLSQRVVLIRGEGQGLIIPVETRFIGMPTDETSGGEVRYGG
jgi:hypothetical protein